jgi:hypothetical protein
MRDNAISRIGGEIIQDKSVIPDSPTKEQSEPYDPNEIKIGCLVRWNKKALIDFNPDHWWATNKEAVKVKNITTSFSPIWGFKRTIHFETPIETNWSGETMSVFEDWLEIYL